MDELKRCSGYKKHWVCADEYPDHMVPLDKFCLDSGQPTGHHGTCRRCTSYRMGIYNSTSRPLHPITGTRKMHWKTAKAIELGGDIKNRHAPEWKFHLNEAEVMWGMEINSPLHTLIPTLLPLGVEPHTIPKFKSKKPKFNQVQYKGSPPTPRDSTKEVEPQEGPGDVYIMIDTLKMPGLVKIGTTTNVGKRLKSGDTWGAFSCLYKKEFERSYEAEAKVHELLDDYRVYSNKEWFSVDTDLAIKTIEDLYEVQ